MFYREEYLKNILSCKKCNERLDEPRALPCGSIICNTCAKLLKIEINKFKCISCSKQHLIEDEELPINKDIKELLDFQPAQVSRGRSHDKFVKTLHTMNTIYNQITLRITNGIDFVEEHCLNLKNDLQLAKEEHIEALEEYHQTMLNEIEVFKKETISKLEANIDLKNDYNELIRGLNDFHEKSRNFLSNNILDDDLIDKMNEEGEKLVEKATKENNFLQWHLFNYQQLLFIKNLEKIEFKNILGKLKNQPMISTILNSKQFIDLLNLCKFDLDKNWNLIYRASQDGFSAKDFHSKCDNKDNTLIVIQSTNGNIFGGFTNQNWSGNNFKFDSNSFIFSFTNNHKSRSLIPIKYDSLISIQCNPSLGPTFGRSDLYICDNSNLNESSHSNLGAYYAFETYSYGSNEAKSFLAGSPNFLTSEIEVFELEIKWFHVK